MIDLKKGIEIGETCDKCGSPMLIKRVGKFGPFIACSGYPECTNTRELETPEPESESGEEEIEPCENCGKPMAIKRGRFGQFLACTGYPECKTTRKLIATKQGGLRAAKPDQILDEKCPRCERQPGRQAGPLRRVHRLHAAIRSASTSSTRRPASCVRRTPTRAATSSSGSRSAARRSSAARTIPTATSCCGTGRSPRPCPEVRRAVPRREDHQEARPPAALQQRRVRLRAVRRAA